MDVQDYIDHLIRHAYEVEFLNHNFTAKNSKWVTLEEVMKSSDLASNNCTAVAWMIEEESNELLPDRSVTFDDGYIHAFNIFTDPDGKTKVIDFTAHQYSDDLPVPFIETPDKWRETINKYASEKYAAGTITEESFAKI